MIKKLLYIIGVLLGCHAGAQQCPTPVLISPANGSINNPVDTSISWTGVTGVPSYILSIGTTPFGTDILNRQNVGSATTYTPPLGLPENTEIFVTVTLFFFQAGIPEIVCSTESFHTVAVTAVPPCTVLSSPVAGAINVNVSSNISWNYAPTANSYDLVVETMPGNGDIFSGNVGNLLSYDPGDFPPNTEIFVTITPRNSIGSAISCTTQSFTTGDLATLPTCTSMITPANGEVNVALSPLLEWQAVPGANGYRVTIGLSPFSAEILNDVIFLSNATFVIEFEPNRTFFVRIVPFNDAGQAIGCIQETFSTLLGCGPYFDSSSGELITLNPVISFPDTVSFCENQAPVTISSPDTADGFRWYSVDPFGNETLLSSGPTVSLNQNGQYRYEAYNRVSQSGNTIECPTTKLFEVVSSEIATITALQVSGQGENLRITTQVRGNGDYEFSLDDANGPYQDSPVFDNVPSGNHTIYVRDKNGCGIVSKSVTQEVALDGFPRFFTPNGDGINDRWQYEPPATIGELNLNIIQIYDRFGRLLIKLDPGSEGWDGTYNGRPLPSDDYWFRAEVELQDDLQGHFSLKR